MDKEDPRETATEVWMDGGMGTEGWGQCRQKGCGDRQID